MSVSVPSEKLGIIKDINGNTLKSLISNSGLLKANGGIITLGNLLPICSDCNSSMGTINWDEYIDKYTNFRIRIYEIIR